MTKSKKWKCLLVSLLVTQAHVAGAVCLDANLTSGYHQPLKGELQSSVAVIVGEVEKVTNLSEDASDPGRWTAMVYRVRVLKVLRGNPASEIDIRDENDSGRFGFELGKKYVLFVGRYSPERRLGKEVGAYFVNSCGNSGLLSHSAGVLAELGGQPGSRD